MAEDTTQEEVIIIEDGDEESENKPENDDESNKKAKEKKLLIIASVVVVTLLLLLITLLIVFLLQDKSTPQKSFSQLSEKFTRTEIPKIVPSNIETMIAKANYLYSNGNRDKALKLYSKISNYNESLSKYNLGVAQLSNKQYKVALESFKSAIKNGEHICVSAINAAVCSLYLQDNNNFQYYIDLAESYLPSEVDSKLYSYYFSLIKYYKEDYYQALASLKYRSSKEYEKNQNKIESNILSLYQSYSQSIEKLEASSKEKNALTLALLYANIGELHIAERYVQKALFQDGNSLLPQLTLAYIELKTEQIGSASDLLKKLDTKYKNRVNETFPIITQVKRSLFDTKDAQKYYREKLSKTASINYQKIFYFSPYKAFNANRTISYIRKGNANIYIDDIEGAKSYLQKGVNTSNVNHQIVQAIQKAISHRLRDANLLFLKAHEQFPKHSILNYNLALTYAQLGDIENAHKYFLESYYQDASNYTSGIYAVMCEKILKIQNPKLLAIIKTNLADEEDAENFQLYRVMIHYTENNFIAASRWLNENQHERPLYLILKTLIAQGIGKNSSAKFYSEKLATQLKDDILSHLIYIDTHYKNSSDVSYVKNSLKYLRKQNLSFDDLYFGADITRVLYIQMGLVTGKLFAIIQKLEHKMDTTLEGEVELIKTLALAYIYNQEFEKSYILYNQLIDAYKVRDSATLFLAALASIGSEHHANAIALLELAKIRNTKNFESRYALGLLYMEANNNSGASIQFANIGNGFKSHFFDFKIDSEKLLFEKNKIEEKKRKETREK